jgi:malonyl CoA-acyl carrier protein transacylase
MGQDIFARFPAQIREADAILGYSIAQLCLEDDGTRLNRTEFTQPALYTVCALTWLARTQDEGAAPDFVAGHSLGEYAALFAAEAFDFATGLRLVQKRGALMGAIEGGGMAAVLRLPIERLRAIIAEGRFDGIDIANLNSPQQTVLAGPVADLERLAPLIETANGIVMMLKVRTAFHSRHMRAVREDFAATLETTPFQPLMLPVVANVTAKPYLDGAIPATLAQQIDHPVRWTDSVRYLLEEPDPVFVEIGPGKVLTRLVKEISAAVA